MQNYFYSVLAQVIARADGVPVELAILPGRFADIDGFAQLPLEFSEGAQLTADFDFLFALERM